MKIFVSVFLLIFGPFSVIQTVHGLNCYVVNTTTECESERKEAKESDDKSSHQAFSKYFACVRQKMIQMQKDTPCEPESASCATLTYELKDKTQLLIKSCEKSEPSVCKALQRMNDEEFKFSNFVKNSNCDFCSSEKCNNKTANDKPLLPSTEEPSVPIISCHYTAIDENYVNCIQSTSNIGINQDEYNRRIIDGCLRESISNEYNIPCKKVATTCSTLVYELNDQTEIMVKFCDNSINYICNSIKNDWDRVLGPIDVVKRSYCDSCSSDYCNNRTSGNKPAPTLSNNNPTPPPRDKPRDKHSAEEKLHDSSSVISTFIPSATAVFVTVFIIHILLGV